MKPGPATSAGVIPINITYANGAYVVSPGTPNIKVNETAQFNATNQGCTICFNPTTTPFGASQNVPMGGTVDIPVGATAFNVGYCVANYGSTCTAPPPSSGLTATTTGTIKVTSGGTTKP